VTLTSLLGQTFRDFRLVVSDQTEAYDATAVGEVSAVLRVLRSRDHEVETHRHLPRRGLAEHRQFLLDRVRAPYALYLDDDVILEPDVVERLLDAIRRERCGFVGSFPAGLSHLDDVRPDDQVIEFWDGPVTPEAISPESPAWERARLHRAANLFHLQNRLGLRREDTRVYKVAWVGATVLYDTAKLRDAGGFTFWSELPSEHAGEDVFAQLCVMARYGGCAIVPSGAYHMEVPTTIPNRVVDAPRVLPRRMLAPQQSRQEVG
jgi:hypothetical protein